MKKIVLALIFIILVFDRGNASITAPLQKDDKSHSDESLNISSWSIEDAATQAKISSVQPSPDGKYVIIESYPAYVDDTKNQPSEISLINTGTKEIVWKTQSDWMCFMPHWAPDGKNISFLRVGEEGKTILLISSPHRFEPIEIAQGTWDISDYFWSPDSKSIVFLVGEETIPEGDEDYLVIEPSKSKSFLYLLKLEIPIKDHIEPKAVFVEHSPFPKISVKPGTMVSWSPDSKNIVFVGIDPENDLEGIFNINIPSGKLTMIEDKGKPNSPMYSPEGKLIAYVANIEEDFSNKTFAIKRRHVFFKEVGEQSPQKLASTFEEQPTLIGWFPDGEHLLVYEGYKTIKRLYKLPINGEKPEILNANTEDFISTVSLSHSRKSIGFLSESLDKAPVASTSPLKRFLPNPLSLDFLQSIPIKSEVIQWKSFDGKEIEGILIYPSFYQSGKTYPLVIAAHDGPYEAWEKRFMGGCYNDFPFSPAVLSAQGYAVFLPNIRGSSNYGIEFGRANQKDLGGGDFKDLLSGVDFLVEKGIADPEKLAIWGWGYGGYLAAWATTQTNRFKAAIVGAGIIDFISFFNRSKTDILENYLGGPFWENKNLWLSRSPIMKLQNVHTPTLLQYGLGDKDFPANQGKELFIALKQKNIPTKMMLFLAEGHKFQLLSLSRKVALTSLQEWLDQSTGPVSKNNKAEK
ncbi:MAG: S9 family peptidase [Alphaproteobacteria bacterium]|nr:S9 family peptidase [Alphaproteobacteria bacterium]